MINNQSLHQGHGGLEMLGFNPNVDPEGAPDFWFGAKDEEVMKDRLAEDFMRRMRDVHGSISVPYGDFVTSIANETPARLADIDKVTAFLVEEKELDLRNAGNGTKRTSVPVYRDTIGVAQQPKLWSLSGR